MERFGKINAEIILKETEYTVQKNTKRRMNRYRINSLHFVCFK